MSNNLAQKTSTSLISMLRSIDLGETARNDTTRAKNERNDINPPIVTDNKSSNKNNDDLEVEQFNFTYSKNRTFDAIMRRYRQGFGKAVWLKRKDFYYPHIYNCKSLRHMVKLKQVLLLDQDLLEGWTLEEYDADDFARAHANDADRIYNEINGSYRKDLKQLNEPYGGPYSCSPGYIPPGPTNRAGKLT
jgi:hypothetical protein